jgi:hypothetical protein
MSELSAGNVQHTAVAKDNLVTVSSLVAGQDGHDSAAKAVR